jgi:hypothetical protein
MASGARSFSARREQWVQALDGPDANSVHKRLMWMMWHSATYRMINKSRDLAPRVGDGKVELNGTVHEFIDHMFFDNQMIVIRNLLDRAPINGDGGVYSLCSVIQDVISVRPRFTRQAMFDAEGLQYDCDASPATGQRGNWLSSLRRHKAIDWLCGVTAETRSPVDAIRLEVLEYLLNSMRTECDTIVEYVNQHIAHSATPGSREGRAIDGVTLSHIWAAQKIALQYASFINVYLLGRNSMGGLPIPQYDHLLHFEKPWVRTEDLHVLDAEWHSYEDKVDEWCNFGIEALGDRMNTPQQEDPGRAGV